MDLKESIYYDRKYHRVTNLLCSFLESGYENISDIDTIKSFVETESFDKKFIGETIEELKQVLALDPFPWEWIKHTANKYPPGKSHESTSDDYYKWVTWMLNTLIEETRKVGKL